MTPLTVRQKIQHWRDDAGHNPGYVLEKAGSSTCWMTPVAQEPWVYGYQGKLAHLIQCFNDGQPPRQTFRDSLIDNAVTYAAYRSIALRTWERIDLSDLQHSMSSP